TVRELLAIFDEEIQRLPERYRLPLVLCCLEGCTQEQAARRLGWGTGSVKGRLERGRAPRHAPLARRGLTLAAAPACPELARAATVLPGSLAAALGAGLLVYWGAGAGKVAAAV